MRDSMCVMFEAPVLAAGAFYRACQTSEVDPSRFAAKWKGTDEGEEQQLGWVDVFDVYEEEAAEAAKAIENDVHLSHEQHTH